MCKTICARVDSGMITLMRVADILKRKQFNISGFSMDEIDDKYSRILIKLNENEDLGIKQAMLHMKKLADVYEIEEYKGEN